MRNVSDGTPSSFHMGSVGELDAHRLLAAQPLCFPFRGVVLEMATSDACGSITTPIRMSSHHPASSLSGLCRQYVEQLGHCVPMVTMGEWILPACRSECMHSPLEIPR